MPLFAESYLQLLHQDPSPHCNCALAWINDHLPVLRQVDNHAMLDGGPGAVAPSGRHEGNVRFMGFSNL